jgi:hypothetical protein
LVDRGIAAMGGRTALETISKGRFHILGHFYHLEQSERPEGPYFAMYEERDEELDFAQGAIVATVKLQGTINPAGFRRSYSTSGKIGTRLLGGDPAKTAERLAVGPERVLLLAASARDLESGPRSTLQDVPHHTVRFHWGKVPVTVFLNDDTGLPTAVETTSPREGFYRTWGDVTFRTLFSNWEIKPGKRFFPTLWTTEWNGIRIAEQSLLKADFEEGPATSSAPEPVLPAPLAPYPKYPGRVVDVAPGIVQFAMAYNCAVVEQPDGLVMIEATFSPTYTDSVLDEVAKRFPGKKVKAVVTTSDSWPHFGGLRAIAARGIPIYALARNRPILTRFLTAPHVIEPDALSQHPVRPRVTYVDKPVQIGSGPTAVRLFPLRGEGSERMMAAYIPGLKLLYGSDLVQHLPNGSFASPGYLAEIRQMVEREHLEVKTIFAMHATPIPWTTVLEALDKI